MENQGFSYSPIPGQFFGWFKLFPPLPVGFDLADVMHGLEPARKLLGRPVPVDQFAPHPVMKPTVARRHARSSAAFAARDTLSRQVARDRAGRAVPANGPAPVAVQSSGCCAPATRRSPAGSPCAGAPPKSRHVPQSRGTCIVCPAQHPGAASGSGCPARQGRLDTTLFLRVFTVFL